VCMSEGVTPLGVATNWKWGLVVANVVFPTRVLGSPDGGGSAARQWPTAVASLTQQSKKY